MALIYRATLSPSKLDLISAWLPGRSWSGGGSTYEQLGAYRFDDPAGEVGTESFLLRTEDGAVLHVPLTYRAAPLDGAEQHLVGTTDHSVLGLRWVYDGCADPVWVTAAATTAVTGGTQVEELVDVDGRLEPREPTATVAGSGTSGTSVGDTALLSSTDGGSTTVVRTAALDLVVVRVVGASADGEHTLTGRWAQGGPAVLAAVVGGAG